MKKRIFSLMLIAALFLPLSCKLLPAAAAVTYADTAGHWAAEVINTWTGYEVIRGDGENFRPDDFITRGDLALIINRVMNFAQSSENTFHDLDNCSEEQLDAILKLNAAGVMLGFDGYMRPNHHITRQEASVMLGRMLHVAEQSSGGTAFNDLHTVSGWALNLIRAMSSLGYITPRDNNNFEPHADITRAEVVLFFDNMLKGFYNKSGTYTVSALGNAVINTTGVVLEQVAIVGDLFITEGVGDGVVTLSDVTVAGNIYVMGGGPNSIKLTGRTNVGNIYHEKSFGNPVKYSAQPPASIENIYVPQGTVPVEIDGAVRNLYLAASNMPVKISNAELRYLSVDAPGITLTTDATVAVSTLQVNQKLISLGKGAFSDVLLAAAADGSSFDSQPKKVTLSPNGTVFLAGQTYSNNGSYDRVITTVSDNIPPSIASRSLNAVSLTPNGGTIGWTAASDNVSAPGNLKYALFYSVSPNLNSVAEIEANGIMLIPYTANKLSVAVDNLKNGETYYFNVIVKDQADNKSCYNRYTLKIGTDTSAPTPGGASAISVTNIRQTEITLEWQQASDNVTAVSKLKYALYQSESANLTSLDSCTQNGKEIMKQSENVTSFKVTGLTAGKTYYFNVVVWDEAGNYSVYSQRSATPTEDSQPPVVQYPIISVSEPFVNKNGDYAVRVSWSAASDNSSETEKLQYALYYSQIDIPTDNIRSLDGIRLKKGLVPAMPMTDNKLFFDFVYTNNGPHYFNVIVQDEATNQTAYTMALLSLGSDTTPPVVPDKEIKRESSASSSINLSWKPADDVSGGIVGTPENQLRYAVYYVNEKNLPPSISFNSVANIREYADWNSGFSANRLSHSVSNLKLGESYIINVIVQDNEEFMACYDPIRFVSDSSVPSVPYSTLTPVTNGSGIDISWFAAYDNVTSQADLQYAVYYSRSVEYSSIADIENKAHLLMNYSANTLSANMNFVSHAIVHYFYVIVTDEAGNKSKYTNLKYELLDTDSPVLPFDRSISYSVQPTGTSNNSFLVTLSWHPSVDNVSATLTYSIYYSSNLLTNPTVSDVKSRASLLAKSKGLISYPHTNRPAATAYYYVIVEDDAGNTALYDICTANIS